MSRTYALSAVGALLPPLHPELSHGSLSLRYGESLPARTLPLRCEVPVGSIGWSRPLDSHICTEANRLALSGWVRRGLTRGCVGSCLTPMTSLRALLPPLRFGCRASAVASLPVLASRATGDLLARHLRNRLRRPFSFDSASNKLTVHSLTRARNQRLWLLSLRQKKRRSLRINKQEAPHRSNGRGMSAKEKDP